MKIVVDWETDGKVVGVPNKVVEVPAMVYAEAGTFDEKEQAISDWLSDHFGWLHNGWYTTFT